MPNSDIAPEARIDKFFAGPGSRADKWSELLRSAELWREGSGNKAGVETALAAIAVTEY